MKKLLLLGSAVVVLAAGCSHSKPAATSSSVSTTSSTGQTVSPPASTKPATTTPAPASGSGAVVKATQTPVAIKNFAFSPTNLTVKKGTTVIWLNEDNAAHTVISTNGGPVSGTIQGSTSFTYTFTKVGTYTYHDSLYQQMNGSVTVTE